MQGMGSMGGGGGSSSIGSGRKFLLSKKKSVKKLSAGGTNVYGSKVYVTVLNAAPMDAGESMQKERKEGLKKAASQRTSGGGGGGMGGMRM